MRSPGRRLVTPPPPAYKFRIMATNVDVPALGESVREAVLIKWHKADGETVYGGAAAAARG